MIKKMGKNYSELLRDILDTVLVISCDVY